MGRRRESGELRTSSTASQKGLEDGEDDSFTNNGDDAGIDTNMAVSHPLANGPIDSGKGCPKDTTTR